MEHIIEIEYWQVIHKTEKKEYQYLFDKKEKNITN